jgi:hypothetical protein
MREIMFNWAGFLYITTLVSFLVILFLVEYQKSKYGHFLGKWDVGISLKIMLLMNFVSLTLYCNLYISHYSRGPFFTVINIFWLILLNIVGAIFVYMVVDGIWGYLKKISDSIYYIDFNMDETENNEVNDRIKQIGIFAPFIIVIFFGVIILLINKLF